MGGLFLFSSPSSCSSLLLLMCFLSTAFGGVHFTKLPQTLSVTASPKPEQVLMAGEDKIQVSWQLNQTLSPSTSTSSYKKVKVKLCYAPISQQSRGWRKTNDDLKKDKTCQFTITTQPYNAAAATTFNDTIERDVPTAKYFIRAYVIDANGDEVAYGQTTNAEKATNLFDIVGISGRHASLDIAAACFSAFSVVSLIFFFVKEKKLGKK